METFLFFYIYVMQLRPQGPRGDYDGVIQRWFHEAYSTIKIRDNRPWTTQIISAFTVLFRRRFRSGPNAGQWKEIYRYIFTTTKKEFLIL